MMRTLLVVGVILIFIANSIDASQITSLIRGGFGYPITRTIRHLQPSLSWEEANKRGNIIYRLAEKNNIRWERIVAVAFKESSFRNKYHEKVCGWDIRAFFTCVYRGLGEMGVNLWIWQRNMDISAYRMLTDLEYGYIMGVRVLKLRKNQKDRCWVGTYNSFTPRFKRRYCKQIFKIETKIGNYINEMLSLR